MQQALWLLLPQLRSSRRIPVKPQSGGRARASRACMSGCLHACPWRTLAVQLPAACQHQTCQRRLSLWAPLQRCCLPPQRCRRQSRQLLGPGHSALYPRQLLAGSSRMHQLQCCRHLAAPFQSNEQYHRRQQEQSRRWQQSRQLLWQLRQHHQSARQRQRHSSRTAGRPLGTRASQFPRGDAWHLPPVRSSCRMLRCAAADGTGTNEAPATDTCSRFGLQPDAEVQAAVPAAKPRPDHRRAPHPAGVPLHCCANPHCGYSGARSQAC